MAFWGILGSVLFCLFTFFSQSFYIQVDGTSMLLALLHAYLQNRKQLFLGVAKIAAKWTDLTFLPHLTLTPSQIPKYKFFLIEHGNLAG